MTIMRVAGGVLCMIGITQGASGQATSEPLVVKAVAEVETAVMQNGHGSIKLKPANLVVPGDRVIYTLEIRNAGASVLHTPVVIYPIPAHVTVVADSATGPGAEVSYSTDGGHSFGRGKAEEITHIRWQLHHDLKANSVAYARFRAVVK